MINPLGQGPECLYESLSQSHQDERAKYFPDGSFQGNFNVQEVLDSAMGFLKTQNVTFSSDSLEVLQFFLTRSWARGSRTCRSAILPPESDDK